MSRIKIFISSSFVILSGLLFGYFAFDHFVIGAQQDLTGLAISVSIKDTNVSNGDIICSGKDSFSLCKTEYDSSMYGVIDDGASLDVSVGGLNNPHLVVPFGQANVKVSSNNGNIKTGDYITTSKTAGVGELAAKTGYVLGTAMEDYSSTDTNAVGSIKVSLNPHAQVNATSTARQNIIDILRSGLSGLGVDPISALRYVLASGMVLASFAIGFIYFGRIAKSGVEAIGRNPLAGVRIQASVIINVAVLLAVVAAGLLVAYLILAI